MSTPPPTFLTTVNTAAFWTLTSFAAVALAVHAFADDDTTRLAAFHAVSGYAALLVAPLVLWGALGGRARLATALVLQAITLVWVLPGHFGRASDAPADLRIVTSNLLFINPHADALIEELVAYNPDILLFQEVSYAWADTLAASDALRAWPYREVIPMNGAFGIAVLSRAPVDIVTHDLRGVPMLEVDVHQNGRSLRLYNVHTLPPRQDSYTPTWQAQMQDLAALPTDGGPVILAGDFNATRHTPAYKRLLRAGYADAHSVVGRASAHTWPNGLFPVPPMRLDHVLVGGGLQVLRVQEGQAIGTDHAPVIVDVSWATVPPRAS